MSEQAPKRGRPAGKAYPRIRSMRFSDRDLERMSKLADKLELTEVQVVRIALRKLAEAEGLE